MNDERNIHAPSPTDFSLNGKEKRKLALRSEAVQEIISRKPAFIEKWALLVFLSILFLLLTASWWIRYPDVIEASAFLTADHAPKEIIPRQDGRLVRLFVRNGDLVRSGQIMGWIESTASHQQVAELSAQLDSSMHLLFTGQTENVSRLFTHSYDNLGELQIAYQQFIAAWQQFNDYLVNGFYSHKKALLQNDIHNLQEMNKSLLRQKELTDQDIRLAEETFKANDILNQEKVISPDEYRTQKSKFVNKQMTAQVLNNSLLTNLTQQRDKQKEVDQIDHDVAQQKTTFQQALESLRSTANDWTRKYMLVAPEEGRVEFQIPVQENQFVQIGKPLGFINPTGTRFYAQISLPQTNFGKIDTGLQVQLRFDAYPYQEFGFVRGTLNYTSKIATDSGFLATVRLDDGLQTNHHFPIQYKNGLKARAEVVTENMRLLQRLYYSVIRSTSSETVDPAPTINAVLFGRLSTNASRSATLPLSSVGFSDSSPKFIVSSSQA